MCRNSFLCAYLQVFKNVELRLDVLQEEVGLPIVFRRGFVQELKVFLPLTNLLREHIRVALINVEVIAHTPASLDAHAASPRSSSTKPTPQSPGTRPQDDKAGCSGEEDGRDKGLLEGWVQSLLNRIAINVKLEVHNMVFKYETAAFVSSLSWKLLSLQPFNHRWQPAFQHFHGPCKASFQGLTVHDGIVLLHLSPCLPLPPYSSSQPSYPLRPT